MDPRPILGGYGMHVAVRDGEMHKQGFMRHVVVALHIAARQTTFIAKVDLHILPVNRHFAQQFVTTARCFTARQGDAEDAAFFYRLCRDLCDPPRDSNTQRFNVVMHNNIECGRYLHAIHLPGVRLSINLAGCVVNQPSLHSPALPRQHGHANRK